MNDGEIVRRVRPEGSPEEAMEAERPKVYAVVQGVWKGGDHSGTLLRENGEAPWGHMSSNEYWLLNDLTTSFKDRADQLLEWYPEGYDVVWIKEAEIPAEVLSANKAWGESRDDEKADAP